MACGTGSDFSCFSHFCLFSVTPLIIFRCTAPAEVIETLKYEISAASQSLAMGTLLPTSNRNAFL